MTSQEYKDLATANGYKLGTKTDAELLADYAFHKAACAGMEEELFSAVYGTDVETGERKSGLAAFHFPWRTRLMVALDGLDSNRPVGDIWPEVCRGRPKKSECHDAEGNLILTKL